MAIVQTRIYELDTYTQLASGAGGYVNPATVWLAVDNSGWTDSKKFSLSQMFIDNHIESSTLSGLSSVAVEATFGTVFSATNYYLNIWAYKEVTKKIGGSNVTVRQDVPFHSLVTAVDKFTLTLYEYASVVVKYYAYE